jgi:predicted regulator of Ras-like GTPase activity (Roadblock/LC7/MglB family)
MFNSLRKLFGRRGGTATVETAADYEQDAPAPVQQSSVPRSVRVDAQSAPAPRTGAGNAPSSVGVPLKSIIARLAPDLMQRVRLMDVGEAEIFIPTQKVLTQISTGSVRISFGELRQLAPPGTFTAENDRDRTLIELPLQEILARINPGLFMRRPAQRQVDVPDEVVGPFGGQSPVAVTGQGKGATTGAPPARNRPATTGPGVPPPMRSQPPQAAPISAGPQSVTPRGKAPVVPNSPIPRAQPPAQPGASPANQPIFARIRPSGPAQTPPPVPPPAMQPAAPELEDEPTFKSNHRFTPATTQNTAPAASKLPPIFSPIAPEPEPAPAHETDVIQMPDVFSKAAPAPAPAPVKPIAPAPVKPVAAAPTRPPAPAPIAPTEPATESEPEPIRFSAPPAEPAMPSTTGETRFITVSVAELSESWPEAVRNEISANKLAGSWVGLPLTAVEGIIKAGKIAFPWKALRSWIKPPIPAASSPYDTTMLDLPMKVVTPLFLAELKATRAQKRYSMDDAIPDLFFNSQPAEATVVSPAAPAAPQPPPILPIPAAAAPPPHAPAFNPAPTFTRAPAPAPKAPAPKAPPAAPAFPVSAENARPADTNYFARGHDADQSEESEQPEEAPVFMKKGTNAPGTAFLNRYATPNEIVSKAATLDGVDGALIALPDGLLVASRIPTNMNADTIAAFLPQIFGRVSQCTRELRLGELNNLNFTVGSIPWKIFRVGSIYFAAFGRPGVPLPTSQLVGLAAELDRKAK